MGQQHLHVSRLTPHPANVRDDLGDLTDLADSIRENGILQPIVVQSVPAGGGQFQIVAGHRRYAAARKAGLEQKVSPHWMRHAHASHALDRSAPIHLVQATLGHASVSTTGRYLHARPTESSSFYLPN